MVDHILGMQELEMSQRDRAVSLKLLDDYHSSQLVLFSWVSVRIWYSGLVWLKFGIDLLKYPINPIILCISVMNNGFFFSIEDTAMMFLGSAVHPPDHTIRPRYKIYIWIDGISMPWLWYLFSLVPEVLAADALGVAQMFLNW